jgi:hypothetical protein
MIAKSAMNHSAQFLDRIAMRSPARVALRQQAAGEASRLRVDVAPA